MVREQCHRSIFRLVEPSLTRGEIDSFKYVTLLECALFAVSHPDYYCAFTHTYESFRPCVGVENPSSKLVDTPTLRKDNPLTRHFWIDRGPKTGGRINRAECERYGHISEMGFPVRRTIYLRIFGGAGITTRTAVPDCITGFDCCHSGAYVFGGLRQHRGRKESWDEQRQHSQHR